MARRADPGRIDIARREAAIARLISSGEPPDRAVARIVEWAAALGRPPGRTDWEGLDAWLAERRRSPP